jgi:hypothetical protein
MIWSGNDLKLTTWTNNWRSNVRVSSELKRIMQIGMIGLGRMGANMLRRLQQTCVVFDRSP